MALWRKHCILLHQLLKIQYWKYQNHISLSVYHSVIVVSDMLFHCYYSLVMSYRCHMVTYMWVNIGSVYACCPTSPSHYLHTSGINLRKMSREVLLKFIQNMYSQIMLLKLLPHRTGTNELTFVIQLFVQIFIQSSSQVNQFTVANFHFII